MEQLSRAVGWALICTGLALGLLSKGAQIIFSEYGWFVWVLAAISVVWLASKVYEHYRPSRKAPQSEAHLSDLGMYDSRRWTGIGIKVAPNSQDGNLKIGSRLAMTLFIMVDLGMKIMHGKSPDFGMIMILVGLAVLQTSDTWKPKNNQQEFYNAR